VCRLEEKVALPPRAAAITFDDGYRNVYSAAWPVLSENQLPATVFLVPGLCGGKNEWVGQAAGVPPMNLLRWEEIAEMSRNGMDFGAHSMTHADLSRLSPDRARAEVVDSKSAVEDRLGRPVDFFAWPFGRVNHDLNGVIREHFAGAITVEMDYVTEQSNPYKLPRIDMYYFSRNERFQGLGGRGFARYIAFRRILRSVRARLSAAITIGDI